VSAVAAALTLALVRLPASPLRAGPAASLAQPASKHLVLGVVRNDGILLPFAAFDGSKWSTPWPFSRNDVRAVDLPVSVASVPRGWWGGEEPGPWNLWARNAAAARGLLLQSPAMVHVGVSKQLGFRTDHPPVLPPVPPFELPFPKIGLAVAGDATVIPVATVSSLAATWKTFAATLQADIDKAEERTIGALRDRAGWRHPFNRPARAALAPQLEAWYISTVPDSDVSLSYVEAVKKYPLLPADEGCGLETFVSGWVHHSDKTAMKPRINLKAVVTYCDRRSVSYLLPFGQIHGRGRTYWIVQLSGQDHEWYAVAEGGPERVKYVAEYQAGRALPE
jgi:hypothetical protein